MNDIIDDILGTEIETKLNDCTEIENDKLIENFYQLIY